MSAKLTVTINLDNDDLGDKSYGEAFSAILAHVASKVRVHPSGTINHNDHKVGSFKVH